VLGVYDRNGRYFISLPTGSYTVTISKSGFTTKTFANTSISLMNFTDITTYLDLITYSVTQNAAPEINLYSLLPHSSPFTPGEDVVISGYITSFGFEYCIEDNSVLVVDWTWSQLYCPFYYTIDNINGNHTIQISARLLGE
jgi:hypothetical protein